MELRIWCDGMYKIFEAAVCFRLGNEGLSDFNNNSINRKIAGLVSFCTIQVACTNQLT